MMQWLGKWQLLFCAPFPQVGTWGWCPSPCTLVTAYHSPTPPAAAEAAGVSGVWQHSRPSQAGEPAASMAAKRSRELILHTQQQQGGAHSVHVVGSSAGCVVGVLGSPRHLSMQHTWCAALGLQPVHYAAPCFKWHEVHPLAFILQGRLLSIHRTN